MNPLAPRIDRLLQPRRIKWVLAAFVALNLVARAVRMVTGRPLWGDEAMLAINFFLRDYAGLIRPLARAQLAPPGFLWLTRATVAVLGYGEWVLRLWPALAGSLATVLFVPLARRALRPYEALLAVAVFAVSYYPLRHSAECKPYAIDLLCSVALLLLAWSIERDRRRWRTWVAFTAVGVVGAWFSFTSIFVSAAATLWLLVGALRAAPPTRRPAAAAAVVGGAIILASFACMYAVYHNVASAETQTYRDMRMWAWAFPPTDRPWMIPWWLLDVHAGGLLAYPQGGKHFGSSFTLLFVVVGGWTLWNGDARRRRLLGLCLLVLAFGLLAAFLGLYPYGRSVRTTMYAAAPIILLAGVGGWALLRLLPSRRSAVAGAGVAVGVLGIFLLATMAVDLVDRAKTPEDAGARDAIERLAASAVPGEVWWFPYALPENEAEGEFYVRGPTGAVAYFYALRDGPAELVFGAAPADLARLDGRVVRVIVTRDNPDDAPANQAGSEAALTLERLLPDADAQARVLHFGPLAEMLVWRFSPAPARRQGPESSPAVAAAP